MQRGVCKSMRAIRDAVVHGACSTDTVMCGVKVRAARAAGACTSGSVHSEGVYDTAVQ